MDQPDPLDVDLELQRREYDRQQAADQARIHDLWRAIERGMDAQKFLGSSVGQLLIERAETARTAFLEELATLDVEDPAARVRYREIRLQIGILENPFALINEVIQEGKDAEAEVVETETPPPPDA